MSATPVCCVRRDIRAHSHLHRGLTGLHSEDLAIPLLDNGQLPRDQSRPPAAPTTDGRQRSRPRHGHAWVHFTCHGSSDTDNPSASHLLIADAAELSIRDISQADVDGELAYDNTAVQGAKGALGSGTVVDVFLSYHTADAGYEAELCRELDAVRPDRFREDHIRSLINLSGAHAEVGQYEPGHLVADEAVTLARDLVHRYGSTHLGQLADALNNNATQLRRLGRRMPPWIGSARQ